MLKINHFRNSFISIKSENSLIWCDPWLSKANEGLWAESDIGIKEVIDNYGLPDVIYISHIHDDHFDRDLINYLISKKDFDIIIPTGAPSFDILYKRLKSLGVKSKRIYTPSFYKQINLNEFKLTILPQINFTTYENTKNKLIDYDIDSSILIEINDIQIYNQTDNYYSIKDYKKIKHELSSNNQSFKPDISFIPYCAASCYPQSFLEIQRASERKFLINKLFKDMFLKAAKEINSGIYVPAGGTYKLSKPYSFLNKFLAVPNLEELKLLAYNQNLIKEDKIIFDKGKRCKDFELEINNFLVKFDQNPEYKYEEIYRNFENICNIFDKSKNENISKFNQLDCSVEIYLITNQELEKSLSNGQKPENVNKKLMNHTNESNNKIIIYLSEFCLYKLVILGGSWNSVNFGAAYYRTPNIYEPNLDILLNIYFNIVFKRFNSN